MPRRILPVLVVFALACGGGQSAGTPSPLVKATTADLAVKSFMQAVADSNIATMGRFWGSSGGPAAVTRQPADYEQRLGITQVFLRGSAYRIVRTEEVPGDAKRRVVHMELDRRDGDGSTCTRTVPVTVVDAGEHGWIVSAIDISQAGTPGRACRPGRNS